MRIVRDIELDARRKINNLLSGSYCLITFLKGIVSWYIICGVINVSISLEREREKEKERERERIKKIKKKADSYSVKGMMQLFMNRTKVLPQYFEG